MTDTSLLITGQRKANLIEHLQLRRVTAGNPIYSTVLPNLKVAMLFSFGYYYCAPSSPNEIAAEPTGHGPPLGKGEAYNRVYEQPCGSS